MDNKTSEQIKYIWHKVYDLLQGPGKTKTYGAFMALPPKFDNALLNDIGELSKASPTEQIEAVGIIRSKLNICETTGLLGANDVASINDELDKLMKLIGKN